jgi:UDP-4-amino-4,6-dideoxy-N-acetyl-beta-L-altrosamine N-acetyltransferase
MKEIKFENILKANDETKEKVRRWRNKEEIRKLMLDQHIITKEEHLHWIESLKNRNDWKFWVVFIDEIPIGSVYLKNMDFKNLTSEWGFYIGEDDFRGCGIGAIVEYIILEYFFNIMKFKVLSALVLEENISVINMHKKFGFRSEKKKRILDKNDCERILLTIKNIEWNTIRKDILKKLNVKENIIINFDDIKFKILHEG